MFAVRFLAEAYLTLKMFRPNKNTDECLKTWVTCQHQQGEPIYAAHHKKRVELFLSWVMNDKTDVTAKCRRHIDEGEIGATRAEFLRLRHRIPSALVPLPQPDWSPSFIDYLSADCSLFEINARTVLLSISLLVLLFAHFFR